MRQLGTRLSYGPISISKRANRDLWNLVMAVNIVKQFGILTGGITIALDGESALDEACGDWHPTIDQASCDLLQEIQNCVKALPIEVKWRWVEGYQIEKGIRNLDWGARGNVEVDNMAKSYLAQCTAANRKQIPVRLLYEK